jgi:hypothetical protein
MALVVLTGLGAGFIAAGSDERVGRATVAVSGQKGRTHDPLAHLGVRAGRPDARAGAASSGPPTTTATTTRIPDQHHQGPLRVALYGDSLAFEAQASFVNAVTEAGTATVRVHAFPGTAICDFLDQMRADAALWRPQAVVIEFSGNAVTSCMRDNNGMPPTGSSLVSRYMTDAREVIDIFSAIGTRLSFASSPIFRSAYPGRNSMADAVNVMYASLASSSDGAGFVDAGQAVEDHGLYTETLPCLAEEPCSGQLDAQGQRVNVVRAADGVHFCPTAKSVEEARTGGCPIWASGAVRYGRALAAPVVEELTS